MRNLLWRGLALALAGCLSWLMWHWPAPAEPVEFNLVDCSSVSLATGFIHHECVEEYDRTMTTERSRQLDQARAKLARENAAAMAKIEKNQRCIANTLFIRIGTEWRNVGTC